MAIATTSSPVSAAVVRNGVYCGATSSSFTGSAGGYTAIKSLCQTACNKRTAHLCSGEEVIRSASLGMLPVTGAVGWYATGHMSQPAGFSQFDQRPVRAPSPRCALGSVNFLQLRLVVGGA